MGFIEFWSKQLQETIFTLKFDKGPKDLLLVFIEVNNPLT